MYTLVPYALVNRRVQGTRQSGSTPQKSPSGKLRIFQYPSRDAGHVRGRQGFTDDPACAGTSRHACDTNIK